MSVAKLTLEQALPMNFAMATTSMAGILSELAKRLGPCHSMATSGKTRSLPIGGAYMHSDSESPTMFKVSGELQGIQGVEVDNQALRLAVFVTFGLLAEPACPEPLSLSCLDTGPSRT